MLDKLRSDPRYYVRAMFTLLAGDPGSSARRGLLQTRRGGIETPAFMPVGTLGSVKSLSQEELAALGYGLILGNTYHLHLRPGEDLISDAGGLHRFIGWDGAILTDSGGFQVFSLKHLRRVDDEGVTFRSHIDGSARRFTPEGVVDIQIRLGSDILMAFDECPPGVADREEVESAARRTHAWAARCRDHWLQREDEGLNPGALFGIVQGGRYPELRRESADYISALGTPGVAIGGASVGEPKPVTRGVVEMTAPLLPLDRPRYLMGVGMPDDILHAVEQGIDMFDCVLPTRLGRNGTAFTWTGKKNLKNSCYRTDFGPVDPECGDWCCSRYSAAYVRHLYQSNEILAARILSYHNLKFYAELMTRTREAITDGRFKQFHRDFLARYDASPEEAGA